MYQDTKSVEILIIDNFGCDTTKDFAKKAGARYILAKDINGTAMPRDMVFKKANGRAVLCVDCHVMLVPRAIKRLKRYYRHNKNCKDLIQGPLIYDDLKGISTHFEPTWRAHMWGTWATDKRYQEGDPFEIPMQGLGIFSCMKDAWPGFNPNFRGFGGEEGYIHEKFRQAGGKCLCVPWLTWLHRFGRPRGQRYPLKIEDKIHNYAVGHHELGLPLEPIINHFSESMNKKAVMKIIANAVGQVVADQSVEQKDG